MGVMGAKQQLHAYTNSQINIESMSKIHTYKLHMITWSPPKKKPHPHPHTQNKI